MIRQVLSKKASNVELKNAESKYKTPMGFEGFVPSSIICVSGYERVRENACVFPNV